MRQKAKNQSGSAIVAVLLIVAIISIIAAGLMVQQRIDIRRTQQIQTANQAYRYSQAVLYWAAGEIIASENGHDLPEGQQWVRDFPDTIIAHFRGKAKGRLERLDRRINLNSFTGAGANPANKTAATGPQDLANLVSKENPIPAAEIAQVTQNITDWISQTVTNSDPYYQSLTPPYRVAHIPLVSPSELRLIVGVDTKMFEALAPFVITLPTTQSANPNYYLLKTEVSLDDQNLRVYSILTLDSNSTVRMLWSTLGTD